MLDQTKFKRTIIILIYAAIIIALGLLIYFIRKPEATCFDGKQNQAEKKVDCGGPCTPCKEEIQAENLIVKSTAVVPGGNNTYDVVAEISNPNYDAGAKNFKYTFTLKDDLENIVSVRSGSSYIFPGDTRYVAEISMTAENNSAVSSVDVQIADAEWKSVLGSAKPQIGVYSKKFGEAPIGEGYEAEGIIRNESGYDLEKVDIVIILRDANNNIIGLNKTQKDSLRVKEERDFIFNWPYALEGSVQNMEVDPESNVLL